MLNEFFPEPGSYRGVKKFKKGEIKIAKRLCGKHNLKIEKVKNNPLSVYSLFGFLVM